MGSTRRHSTKRVLPRGGTTKPTTSAAPSSTRDAGTVTFLAGERSGTFRSALRSYVVKIHGSHGGSIRSGGAAVTRYSTLEQLRSASGEGWAADTDRYGPYTAIKITAGVDRAVILAPRGFFRHPD